MRGKWIFMLMFVVVSTVGAARIEVSTADALSAAIAAAAAGDEIVIADGSYADWKISADGNGAEGAPVIVRPASAGGVTLTGSPELRITGTHIEIQDLTFDGCRIPKAQKGMVFFDGAQHCRMTGCRLLKTRLEGSTPAIWFLTHACDNRFDHNRIIDIQTRSVRIQIDEDCLENGPPARNRIDHNLFQDVPPLGRNGGETIQIGSGTMFSAQETMTRVDHNLFVRCNGEAEVISNKATGNSYVGNVFRDCKGSLVMRHGSRAVIKDNWFEGGSGAIRLHGGRHTVIGNTVVHCATALLIGYGTPDTGHPAAYEPVEECLIANNTFVDCADQAVSLSNLRNASYTKKRWGGPPWFAAETFSCTIAPHDNTIVNNIFTGTKGTLIVPDEEAHNLIANNLYFVSGTAVAGELGDGAIEADPMFRDAGGGDYRLAEGSPARGAAKPHEGCAMSKDLGSAGRMPPAGPDAEDTPTDGD